MNKYLIIFAPNEENPLRCCCSLRVPLVQQSRQLQGLSYGQKPKCMIFPAICNFRVELHQKIQSKSVTIFQINEVSKPHPLAITNTHTHTPIKVTTFKFYFFIEKSYWRASLTWFHFIKRKTTRFKGISFFVWELFQGDSRETWVPKIEVMQQVTFSLYSADKLLLQTAIFAIFRMSVNVAH